MKAYSDLIIKIIVKNMHIFAPYYAPTSKNPFVYVSSLTRL